MDNPNEVEVYRQRYETYRHLDRLRWQMLQIAIAVGALVVTFGVRGTSGPEWWVLSGAGLLIVMLGVVMLRINHGVAQNGLVLATTAAAIGDHAVPVPGRWWKRSASWVALTVLFLGTSSICLGVWAAQHKESECIGSSSATTTNETSPTRKN